MYALIADALRACITNALNADIPMRFPIAYPVSVPAVRPAVRRAVRRDAVIVNAIAIPPVHVNMTL